MATVETKFGALGTAQTLTSKERAMTTPKRVFISHILPALLSTDKLAQGSSVVREAEREPSYGILLTPDEHVQISRDQINQLWLLLSTPSVESGNILRAAHHGQATSLLGAVHHGQVTTLLRAVHHGQATSLLGAAHGQAGGLVGATLVQTAGLGGTTLAQTGTLVGLTHIHTGGLFGIGMRDLFNSPSPSLAEPFQQLTAGRASDELGLAKDFLKSRIRDVLSEAEDEELEIGIQSNFSRQILTLFAEHGANAVEALAEVLRDKLSSDVVMGILLRQLGRIQQESSQPSRRKLLSDLLRARSVQVRHAAATGLAELDDPEAIPALELARHRERHERPREHLRVVLDQLRETRSGGQVPNR